MALQFLHRIGRLPRVDREETLIKYATGRRVLHLGCVDRGLLQERLEAGDLLHARLATVALELVGVDLDAEGIARLTGFGWGANYVADVESMQTHPGVGEKQFDVVIAGEIIEHVANVGTFLRACRAVLAPHGTLVITTPNAARAQNVLFALMGMELVHPEHLVWFSATTLRRAVQQAQLEPGELLLYQLRDAPPKGGRRSTGMTVLQFCFFVFRLLVVRPLVWLSPALADGLILVAHRAAEQRATEG